MSPETHDPELAALARALSGLAPSAGRLNRDQMLFRAGQASAGWQNRFWRGAAALMALLIFTVGLAQLVRPTPQRVQCILYQRVEPPASSTDLVVAQQSPPRHDTPSAAEEAMPQEDVLSYSRLQRVVFMGGADALPNPQAAFGSRQKDPLLNRPSDVSSWNDWLRKQTP